MTKKEKIKVVKELTTILSHNNTIYLTDTSNIDCNKILDFRKNCFKSNIKFKVIKNKLLRIAINSISESGKDFSFFYRFLKGNNSLITTNVGGSIPAKIIKKHRDKYKNKKPIIKAVYNDDIFYIGDKIDLFINIKSKKELIGYIVGILKYNFSNLICNLHTSSYKILFIIKILLKIKSQ